MMSKKTNKSKAVKVTKPSKVTEPAAVEEQAVVLTDADNNGADAKLLITPTEQVSEQRTDDAPTVDPAPAEAPAPAAAEPAKQKKLAAPKDSRNGVSRPAAGNKCAQVWAALEALKEAGTEITFTALRPTINAEIADATVRTQWSRFRKYHGIAREVNK